MKISPSIQAFLVLSLIAFNQCLYAQEEEENASDFMFEMTLEELLQVEVTTASNRAEKLNRAPATIIVITEQEINERGYLELFDVLNDLPGFDLSRAFGDDNYYAYVRGYRKTTSDQMLLMIDGIIMNHLYNNNMNGFAQYPLQNIKQIEVVYGPASAVYGPNAFTGVINIITKNDGESSVQASTGQNNTNIVDLHFSQKVDDLSINLSGRLYQSDGPDLEGRTPMLEEELFTNPVYWGDFAQTDFTGYKSPIESNFLNASVGFKGLTVGLINYFYESGLGSEFAGGTTLNSGTWQFKENTVYAKYEVTKDKLSSKSLIKYRRSDIPGSATFLWRWFTPEAETAVVAPGQSYTDHGLNIPNTGTTNDNYVVDINYQYAQYWQANNASYSFFQDFAYNARDNFVVNFGLKYERRILNRDYIINTSEVARYQVYEVDDQGNKLTEQPLNLVLGSFPFPERPDDATLDQENHQTIDDRGVYMQAQYSPVTAVTFTGGVRYDYNSVWKGVVSPRIGVVVQPTNEFVAKAFFGTAFLEPSARILYGGWQGSLSNDDLEPEKMRTFEVSAAYTKSIWSAGVNMFYNTAPDAIGQGAGKVPINLGSRKMFGLEANGKVLINNKGSFLSKFRGDLYVSYIKSEEDLADTGDFEETGNMAPVKVKGIVTAHILDRVSLSLQNRYISEIKTVSTNPLGTIDSYFVSDFFVQYNNVLVEGISLGMKVYNVFDKDYFHPGYRDADAGEVSVDHALFNTSWYNSRLPQPERTFMFTMKYTF